MLDRRLMVELGVGSDVLRGYLCLISFVWSRPWFCLAASSWPDAWGFQWLRFWAIARFRSRGSVGPHWRRHRQVLAGACWWWYGSRRGCYLLTPGKFERLKAFRTPNSRPFIGLDSGREASFGLAGSSGRYHFPLLMLFPVAATRRHVRVLEDFWDAGSELAGSGLRRLAWTASGCRRGLAAGSCWRKTF